MELSDAHVGKQLQCNYSPQGVAPIPCAAYLTGPAAIPGTGFFNGGVMVGSPILHPIHTAALMVTRPDPITNPLAAKAPSIFHIRGLPPPASTPIDVVLGDPLGPVGITMATTIVIETNLTSKLTFSPLETKFIALMKKLGVQVDTGATAEIGAQAQAGAEFRASAKALAGPTVVSGPLVAMGLITGLDVLSKSSAKTLSSRKDFDIPHPNKDGWRLRHT